jgi:isopentenyldiphosphate isomerase
MSDADEVLDLVNTADEAIGTIKRGDYGKLASEKLGYIRSVNAFIQNSEGKFWIPRRTASKRIAPNGLDYSMAEHVQSGETYLQACIRGFKEELNMAITSQDLEFIATSRPHSGIYYFDTLYIYKSENVPAYNSDDFTKYYWLSPDDLADMLNKGEPAKSSMKYWLKFLRLF